VKRVAFDDDVTVKAPSCAFAIWEAMYNPNRSPCLLARASPRKNGSNSFSIAGADEVGTLRGLTERRTILDKDIAVHKGRIANTAGDSVLAEFGSAVDAVSAR
jgi:hypothetical protein